MPKSGIPGTAMRFFLSVFVLLCTAWVIQVPSVADEVHTLGSFDFPAGISTSPGALPTFELPWSSDKNKKVVWSGGPHQFGILDKTAKYRSGYGSGLDFACNCGFSVLAMAPGRVVFAGWGDFGYQVAIEHSDGSVLIYGHLKQDSIPGKIEEDAIVVTGDQIGNEGNSNTTDRHLHIELRRGNKNADGTYLCTYACLTDNLGGDPLGWDDLVSLVDGYRIGGYWVDGEGIESWNYDGSAVRGTVVAYDSFPYKDQPGDIESHAMVRVHNGFACSSSTNCEINSDANSSVGTQFADHGVFLSSQVAAASTESELSSSMASSDRPFLISTNVLSAPPPNPTPTPPPTTVPPPGSGGIEIVSVSSHVVNPGASINPSLTIRVTNGQLLVSRGDHLHATPEDTTNTYGAWPVQAVKTNVSAGGTYTFDVNNDSGFRMTAPNTPGNYVSRWQLRVGGNHIGPIVEIPITVQSAPTPPNPSGWRAQYWNGYFSDNPWGNGRCKSDDYTDSIPFTKNWGSSGPGSGCSGDRFSVLYERRFSFSGGRYRFHCHRDGYCRFFIPELGISHAEEGGGFSGMDWGVDIRPGNWEVKIEYSHKRENGDARLEFWWQGPESYLPPIDANCAASPYEWCAAYRVAPNSPSDSYILRRLEGSGYLDHDWGNSGPGYGIYSDFSAEWSRLARFDAGLYRFHTTHDDGVRISVDGQQILDQWGTCCREDTADTWLTSGDHRITVNWFDSGGGANIKVWWEKITACYTLGLTTSPGGIGSVSPNPLLNCPADGAKYTAGTNVVLTANPIAPNDFVGWGGDVSGSDRSISVTMNADRQVLAGFIRCYALNLGSDPNGVIAVNPNPNCYNGTHYRADTNVALYASASAGYIMDSWRGDFAGSANPAIIVMDRDKSIAANFVALPPTSTPTPTPTDTPTATPTPTNTPTITPTPTVTPTTPAGSRTKSFQNGVAPNASYSGAIDTYVAEAQSTTNFGTATSIIVSGSEPTGTGKDQWALLKWNLSSIAGVAQSASLTLDITDHSAGQTYELYEALSTWNETTVKWNTKPTKGTALLGTVRATTAGSLTANLNTTGVAVVQKWLNTPSKNYGFYLLHTSNTNNLVSSSRETSDVYLHPKFTVTYKPPVLTNGPTVSTITSTAATVIWESDTYAKGTIRYRRQGTTSWTSKVATTVLTSSKWRATADLAALTANTTYEFQVRASADSSWTSTRTFRTLTAISSTGAEPPIVLDPPVGFILTIPANLKVAAGDLINVPISLAVGSGDIVGLVFSVDYDQTWLSFDPSDADDDGLPDVISFNLPGDFGANVTWEPTDADGEIDIVLSGLTSEMLISLEGPLASIGLRSGNVLQPISATLAFSADPAPVIVDALGRQLPVSFTNSSVTVIRAGQIYTPLILIH